MLNINNLPSCEGNETISDFCCICNFVSDSILHEASLAKFIT